MVKHKKCLKCESAIRQEYNYCCYCGISLSHLNKPKLCWIGILGFVIPFPPMLTPATYWMIGLVLLHDGYSATGPFILSVLFAIGLSIMIFVEYEEEKDQCIKYAEEHACVQVWGNRRNECSA